MYIGRILASSFTNGLISLNTLGNTEPLCNLQDGIQPEKVENISWKDMEMIDGG